MFGSIIALTIVLIITVSASYLLIMSFTRVYSRIEAIRFRFVYVMFPTLAVIIFVAIVAILYSYLPAEIGYRLTSDGIPVRWMSRNMFVLWALIIEEVLWCGAIVVAWGASRVACFFEANPAISSIIGVMGNMPVLPQLIIGFAAIDILTYNVFGEHILPLWIFTILVSGLGAIVLGVFFIRAFIKMSNFGDRHGQSKSRSE